MLFNKVFSTCFFIFPVSSGFKVVFPDTGISCKLLSGKQPIRKGFSAQPPEFPTVERIDIYVGHFFRSTAWIVSDLSRQTADACQRTSGKYDSRRFRSAGPGGSTQRAVLPAGGAEYINLLFHLIR